MAPAGATCANRKGPPGGGWSNQRSASIMGIILFLAVSINLSLLVFILASGALVTGLSPWSQPHNPSVPDSSLFLSLPL